MEILLVSACLLGIRCRHNGWHQENKKIIGLRERHILLPVCPEQLGGLPTPRPTTEFKMGDGIDTIEGSENLVNKQGKNLSREFLRGADETFRICKMFNIKKAVLKDNSPSCGSSFVYRNGILVSGEGVTSALLRKQGVSVFSELEIEKQMLLNKEGGKMLEGTVKWFSKNKGYGFIETEDDGEYFVHWKSISQEGYKTLEKDDKVKFDLLETDRGIQAINVIRIL